MVQEAVVGVLARSSRSLDDDGRPCLPRGLHDRLYLLQVVDVERPDAIAAVRRFVQKLAHRNQGHVSFPPTRSTRTRYRDRSGKYRRFCASYQRKWAHLRGALYGRAPGDAPVTIDRGIDLLRVGH